MPGDPRSRGLTRHAGKFSFGMSRHAMGGDGPRYHAHTSRRGCAAYVFALITWVRLRPLSLAWYRAESAAAIRSVSSRLTPSRAATPTEIVTPTAVEPSGLTTT